MSARTAASAVNWTVPGDRIANASVVAVDAGGRIRVHNGSSAAVRFLIDVVGYYRPRRRRCVVLPGRSVRAYDSRPSGGGPGALNGGAQRRVRVAGRPAEAGAVATPCRQVLRRSPTT